MSGPGSAPASRTAVGPLIPLFTWSGWLSHVRAGPTSGCVGSRAPARLAPPGPRLGTRGQWFSGSNTFGLLSGRCTPPRVERRKSKSCNGCSGLPAAPGQVAATWQGCHAPQSGLRTPLSSQPLASSPCQQGQDIRDGQSAGCRPVGMGRGDPLGPMLHVREAKDALVVHFPFRLYGKRISQGRLKTLGFGAVSALVAHQSTCTWRACSRVTCRWLKQQPVTAEQRRNLWLGQPCPGPEASIILDHPGTQEASRGSARRDPPGSTEEASHS